MKHQKGSAWIVALGVVVLLLASTLSVIGYAVSLYNGAIGQEQRIVYGHENLQNIKSNYSLKVREMMGVSDKYSEEIQKMIDATFSGRYGEEGSQAQFQWIQENNIQLSPQMYQNIQVVMDAGRTEFQNAQTEFLDIKRMYQAELKTVPASIFYGAMGFPEIDLDDYNVIVSIETTEQFETGVDEAIKF